jgi:hypothetical protein
MKLLVKLLEFQKVSKNSKETTVEASTESSTPLRADFKAELRQALEDAVEATAKHDNVAEDMFQLYTNLLSVDAW